MERRKISELNIGDSVSEIYLLTEITEGNCSTGKFVRGVLSDASGKINVVAWSYTGDVTASDNGCVVYVSGVVEKDKRGVTQIKVAEMYKIDPESVDKSELVPVAPIPVEKMQGHIKEIINQMQDEDYQKLCKAVLNENSNEFINYPAAQFVHDAVVHGLLHHTYKMLSAAEKIAEIYSDHIDKDLLFAGVILHDIGKILEFDINDLGLVSDYSDDGKFRNHLILGGEMVRAKAEEIGIAEDKIKLIENILLSHHGKAEYGAVAQPLTLEAQIVHQIDMLDSRITAGIEGIKGVADGEFSQKIFSLDNIRLYKHIA